MGKHGSPAVPGKVSSAPQLQDQTKGILYERPPGFLGILPELVLQSGAEGVLSSGLPAVESTGNTGSEQEIIPAAAFGKMLADLRRRSEVPDRPGLQQSAAPPAFLETGLRHDRSLQLETKATNNFSRNSCCFYCSASTASILQGLI